MFRNTPEHILDSLRKDLVDQIESVSNLVDDLMATPVWRYRRRNELLKQVNEKRNEMYDTADNVAYLSHCLYGD